jgi:hypothetical protein
MWFFDGEYVVGCVVDVVFQHHTFRLRKIRQLFEIYFRLGWSGFVPMADGAINRI